MVSKQVQQAATAIKNGGLIVYPTESVYGLGCDPENTKAIDQLLKLKKRPVEKGLILIASHIQQILPYIKPSKPEELARALKTWPGFYTWVFPKSQLTSKWLSGEHTSIAVRVTKHKTVCQLCDYLGHALVSTSANITGEATDFSLDQIKTTFGEKVNHYLDEPLGGTKSPSTITNAQTLEVYR